MAQLLVKDLADTVFEALRRRAEQRGASIEDEAREILTAVARPDRESFVRWLKRFRSEQSPDLGTDSVDLLRRDRRRDN